MKFGRKGEKTGVKKTLYISHHVNGLLKWAKKRAKKKGISLSESEIVELLVTSNWKDFCEKMGLDEKEAKSEKERQKLLSIEEQFNLSKKELVRYAQETSPERWWKGIMQGSTEVDLNELLELPPQTIWEKIMSRFGKRDERWVETGQ